MKIAFYAPMKPPNHPTPSGDRRMGRLLMQALEHAGYEVSLASEARTYHGKGDAETQRAMIVAAEAETARLTAQDPPDLWFTYHCYYKAPDLIGPAVAAHFGIPYVIAEASRAKKRLSGPWSTFATKAEAAIDAAAILFAMSPEDRFALDRDRIEGQQIIDLPPFLDPDEYRQKPSFPRKRESISPHSQTSNMDARLRGHDTNLVSSEAPLRLLTVAMMREGAKLDSYKRLAAALPHLDLDWHLSIVGDGPVRDAVISEFAAFGHKVKFRGEVTDAEDLRIHYEAADLFVWPGVNEAYGMVYLEAQAVGLPVIAEDHPGPRSVIATPLTPPEDAPAFASAIEAAARTPSDPRAHILANHSIERAAATLRAALEPLA